MEAFTAACLETEASLRHSVESCFGWHLCNRRLSKNIPMELGVAAFYLHNIMSYCACSPMTGPSSETVPTMVQILVHTPFRAFFRIYRRYVVNDVPFDDVAPMVTSEISRSVDAQSFGGAHKDRVCTCIYRGECACVLWAYVLYCVIFLKKKTSVHGFSLGKRHDHSGGEEIAGIIYRVSNN
jgi:hypothetical protein